LLALAWWLWRRLRALRPDSQGELCSRARFIDGAENIPVSVALQQRKIYFFNADFERSVDLNTVDAVEYLSDLVTGDIAGGALLRVLSRGRSFDFAMDSADAKEWADALPPR